MALSIEKFWNLVIASCLLSAAEAERLDRQFCQVKGAASQANARTLCEWLVTLKMLTRYQAKILLAGRPGPFVYGHYCVQDRIERTDLKGMFRARHLPSGHPVTLQFLAGDAGNDVLAWSDVVRRIVDWPAKNRHVVRCFEAIAVEEFRFVVYEQPRAAPLSQQLAEGKALKPAMACHLIRQLALGLAELHQHGWIAVDIRPARVWLEPGKVPQAKLFLDALQIPSSVDWKSADREHIDPTSSLAERADYCPPELAEQVRVPDSPVDIYGLGCLFFRLLSGREPFPGGGPREKLSRHAAEPIPSLESYGVPTGLADLVATMLVKIPASRPDADRIAKALTAWVEPKWLDAKLEPPRESLESYLQNIRDGLPPVEPTTSSPVVEVSSSAVEVSSPAVELQSPPRDALRIDLVNTGTSSSENDRPDSVLLRRQRTSSSQRGNVWWWAVGGSLALLAAIGLVVVVSRDGSDVTNSQPATGDAPHAAHSELDGTAQQPRLDPEHPSGIPGDDPGGFSAETAHELIPDDGQSLWGSPTRGEPIDLRYVAPDAPLLLWARPSSLLSSDEGRRLLDALGPDFQAARKAWEQSAGIQLEQVREIVIGFHPAGGEMPRTSIVVRLLEPLEEAVLSGWGSSADAENEQGVLYRVNDRTFFMPADAQRRTLVMGSADDMQEVVLGQGTAPLVRRELEQIVMTSDADRHFTLIAAPHFFFADGRPLLSGQRAKLIDPLAWLLGDGLQGVSASVHLGNGFFWEVRLIGQLEHKPDRLASALEQRLDELPRRITDYFFALNPPEYWRALELRFPFMVRETRQKARVGFEGNQVIVNGYLHPYAAHNLVLGSELAIASNPGRRSADGTPPPVADATSLQDYLRQRKINLEFPQLSLEFALRDLEVELVGTTNPAERKVKIEIRGNDLKLDGITRNQQITNFKANNMSVADVLTALAIRANPVPGIEDPSVPDQKLIWVLVPDPDDGSEMVLFTTRKAAQENGYDLPGPFRAKKT